MAEIDKGITVSLGLVVVVPEQQNLKISPVRFFPLAFKRTGLVGALSLKSEQFRWRGM